MLIVVALMLLPKYLLLPHLPKKKGQVPLREASELSKVKGNRVGPAIVLLLIGSGLYGFLHNKERVAGA